MLVFITDATDVMHGNAFRNANTFNDQETGFVDRVDQDSISKMLTDGMKINYVYYTDEPIEDGDFAFTNEAFDEDGKIFANVTNPKSWSVLYFCYV